MQQMYKQDEQSKGRRELKRVGDYTVGRLIGRGNFSVVHVAKHTIANVKVAIKIIDKNRLNSNDVSKIERQINILKNLDHPHIIKLYEVINTAQYLYLATEYASNGELFDFLMEKGRMDETKARKMFHQIVTAIAYCHSRGIVHRDLKAENLLLDFNNDIKLIDFGFSNFQKPDVLLTTFCGSPPYAAPELLLGKAYDGTKADVWSLGVVLYVLVTGGFPFPCEMNKLKLAILTEQLKIPYWVSFACADLIRKMLMFHPTKRISVANIIQHRWLTELNSNVVSAIVKESVSMASNPEESSYDYNSAVVSYMHQHTKWPEEKILEEVSKKNVESSIYGTYQLLCNRFLNITNTSNTKPRRGSRGSITSGKANVEIESSTISAHQFAKLSISTVDNSESDKSDASDVDESSVPHVCKGETQLQLVVGDGNLLSTSSSREEARRHSLCTENLLPLKALLFTEQAPFGEFSNTDSTASATVSYATNTAIDHFTHMSRIFEKNFPYCMLSKIIPLSSLERRASAGEAMLRVSGYQSLGCSFAVNNFLSSQKNSSANSRLRNSIPNHLTIEEEGERNTSDCLSASVSATTSNAQSYVRFAGCPYAKQGKHNNPERRRSWTPTGQKQYINLQQQLRLEQIYSQATATSSDQMCDLQHLRMEFQKLQASTESQALQEGLTQNMAAAANGIKNTPQISVTDENNRCLRLSSPSVDIRSNYDKNHLNESAEDCDEREDHQHGEIDSSNNWLGNLVMSVDVNHTFTEAVRRLMLTLDKLNLHYERKSASLPQLHKGIFQVNVNSHIFLQINVRHAMSVSQSIANVEFIYSAADSQNCERMCTKIYNLMQEVQ